MAAQYKGAHSFQSSLTCANNISEKFAPAKRVKTFQFPTHYFLAANCTTFVFQRKLAAISRILRKLAQKKCFFLRINLTQRYLIIIYDHNEQKICLKLEFYGNSQRTKVKLTNIFQNRGNILSLIIMNVGHLELSKNSLDFAAPASIILGNIGRISFRWFCLLCKLLRRNKVW